MVFPNPARGAAVADAGDVIESPVTGRADDLPAHRRRHQRGQGSWWEDEGLRADAFLPAEHIHQKQEERGGPVLDQARAAVPLCW